MQSGSSREWSKPFNPNPAEYEAFGSHRGTAAYYNIRNRQPGLHYAFADRRHPQGYNRMWSMGFRPDQSGAKPSGEIPDSVGYPQGSSPFGGHLVLMSMPIGKYQQVKETQRKTRMDKLNGPTDSYTAANDRFIANHYRRAPNSGRVFYAYPDHGRNGFETRDPDEEI